VEVTTLLIPGENDSEEELRGIAAFIASVGKEIPWHISRYHPDYKYTKAPPTPVAAMEEAMEIGKEEGLKYIYLGNVFTRAETLCANCGTVLIDRGGFSAKATDNFIATGRCRSCGTPVEGVWE
jgi:pyruvate formate lyase activating enzyme